MWDDLETWISLKATNTQLQYRAALRDICTLLSIERTDEGAQLMKNIGTAEVTRYVTWCKARPAQGGRSALVGERVSLATVKHKVTILHSIFEQMQALGFISANPWTREKRALRAAKGNDRRPHQLIPFEKVSELFQLDFGRTGSGARDRAMFAVGFGGGCRSSEILGLRVVDVRIGQKGACLHLRNTKRQCAELQVLPAWAAEIIVSFVERRRIEGARDIDPLFVNYRTGKPADAVQDRTFRRIFDRYMARIGLTGEYSPHCMRACAITRLLEKGRSHRDVMKFSRHSTPDMVAHYDKMRHAEADDVVNDLDY